MLQTSKAFFFSRFLTLSLSSRNFFSVELRNTINRITSSKMLPAVAEGKMAFHWSNSASRSAIALGNLTRLANFVAIVCSIESLNLILPESEMEWAEVTGLAGLHTTEASNNTRIIAVLAIWILKMLWFLLFIIALIPKRNVKYKNY